MSYLSRWIGGDTINLSVFFTRTSFWVHWFFLCYLAEIDLTVTEKYVYCLLSLGVKKKKNRYDYNIIYVERVFKFIALECGPFSSVYPCVTGMNDFQGTYYSFSRQNRIAKKKQKKKSIPYYRMSEFGDNNRRKFKSHSIRSDCHDLSPRDVRVKRSLLCRELCCLYNGEPPRVELQCIVGRRMTVYIKNKLKKTISKEEKQKKKCSKSSFVAVSWPRRWLRRAGRRRRSHTRPSTTTWTWTMCSTTTVWSTATSSVSCKRTSVHRKEKKSRVSMISFGWAKFWWGLYLLFVFLAWTIILKRECFQRSDSNFENKQTHVPI